MTMKLLVGLGNPGKKYAGTRHNVGFRVVDLVAERLNIGIEKNKFSSLFEMVKIGEYDVCIVKPQTFMNLSGQAVQGFASYYKVDPEDVLVVHDDIDLPFAKLRIAVSSGSGGHNGVSSIIEHLGTNAFYRLKIGVGRPDERIDTADHVLMGFDKEERPLIDAAIKASAGTIFEYYENGVEKAKKRIAEHNNAAK